MELLIILGIVTAVILLTLWAGVKVVPQSNEYVIERFGRYRRTLKPGLNLIIPYFDRVAHDVSVLERQLPDFNVSVITKDNVEVDLKTTVFYRIQDAAKSVYRIKDVDQAIYTTASSIVRSAVGKLELDEIQSSRAHMAQEILDNLGKASEVWGTKIEKTEVIDVIIDNITKAAQRQQLEAERSRRATVTKAEGDRRAIELSSDGELYEAKRQAEAVIVAAEAEALAVRVVGIANAEAIQAQGEALKESPDFVAYTKAKAWNGALPATYFGSGDKAPNMLFQLDEVK